MAETAEAKCFVPGREGKRKAEKMSKGRTWNSRRRTGEQGTEDGGSFGNEKGEMVVAWSYFVLLTGLRVP